MRQEELIARIQELVTTAKQIRDKHFPGSNYPVNYACIFAHSEAENQKLLEVAAQLGKVAQETSAGPIFLIPTLETVLGKLQLIKIRKPFADKPERGYADLTIPDFAAFKTEHLKQPGYTFLQRPDHDMIELRDSEFDVLIYFCNPSVDILLGIK